MNHAITDLNDLENQVLTVIVRNLGAIVFDLKDFLGLAYERSYTHSVLKFTLLGLCKKGWVVRMRRIMGETMYCVPYERYIQHMTTSSMDMLNRLTPIDQDPIIIDCEPMDYDLVMDMIVLFGYIGRIHPQLNKQGQLPKKQADRMQQHVRLTQDHLVALVGNDAAKHSIPLPISFLIDLGLRLGTIRIEHGHIQLAEQRIEQWLGLGPQEVKLQLYGLCFNVHYPKHQHFRQLLVLLPNLRGGRWFSVGHLFERDEGVDMQLVEAYLIAIQELGWIQLGRTMDGTRTLRSLITVDETVQDTNHSEALWFVQPDYEIIVPPYSSYSDHYQLNTYAHLVARNQMYTYRMTEDSVFTAFEQGWSLERIIKHLGSLARYGVPENIQTSFLEWKKQYSGVRLEAAVILRCETEAIAEELMTIPEVASILNEQSRLQPGLFLIPIEEVDFIREKMNTYGYQTDQKSVEQPNNIPTNSEHHPHSGIFHSPLRYDMYIIEERQPEIESLYPGLVDVPSGWLNKYVTYHMSTRKQLLQQAIDWQCYVQLAHEGEDKIVVAVAIIEEQSTPIVEVIFANKKVQLPLDQLEAMCLVVPGIHDVTKYMSTIV